MWRVGFSPDPWAWSDWKYAQDDGRFGGRWDDQLSQFRTTYTADSLYACLVELLAKLRPARSIDDEIMAIDDPDDQSTVYTEYPAGLINFSWFERRAAGHAEQTGRYCYITHSNTVAALRTRFSPAEYGLVGIDFDASLLKDAEVRPFTRAIARWLYEQKRLNGSDLVDGIEFRSRHGDDLKMWAVFERPDDADVSGHLRDIASVAFTPETPALLQALHLHGIALI